MVRTRALRDEPPPGPAELVFRGILGDTGLDPADCGRPPHSTMSFTAAGTPHAWSWAVIEHVESGFVYFRQISARDAARRGSLIKPFPQSA